MDTNDTSTDRAEARYGDETPAKVPVTPVESKTLAAGSVSAAKAETSPDGPQIDSDDDRAERQYPDTPDESANEAVHGVPTGGYSIKPPEGLSIDHTIMREIEPTLKKLNLSNAGAQALMPHVAKFRDRLLQSMTDEHAERTTDWAKEVRADKELGGSNWGATSLLMERAIRAGQAGRDFTDLMEESGLGNHPTIIRFLRNVGRNLPA